MAQNEIDEEDDYEVAMKEVIILDRSKAIFLAGEMVRRRRRFEVRPIKTGGWTFLTTADAGLPLQYGEWQEIPEGGYKR
jgi:hypothetical protein